MLVLNPQEKSLLRYLLEFGAMQEDTLVDYHFTSKDLKRLIEKGLTTRNYEAGTYKLTSVGRKKAKEQWPTISKHRPANQGSPQYLLTQLKNFITRTLKKKLAPQPNLYGCGGNGCAFRLNNGRVLKITSDPGEVLCAMSLRDLQGTKNWDDDFPFPIVFEARDIEGGHSPFIPTYDGCLIATGYYIRETLENLSMQDLLGGTCRKHAMEFEKTVGRPPRNSYELWKFKQPETDHLFEKIQRDIKKQTGIELYDYKLDENWGKRQLEDGSYQIVYRDLACYA